MAGEPASFDAHATSFQDAAAAYERGRPPYPAARWTGCCRRVPGGSAEEIPLPYVTWCWRAQRP